MAGIDDIVQTIVLTGNDDVAAAFEKMREAGEKAFDGIERATEHGTVGIRGLVGAVAGITAAFAAVSVGVFAFVRSTAEAVSGMDDLHKQTGATIDEIAGLKAAFASGGVGAGELEQAFRRLSITVQSSWTQILKESSESSDKLRGDAVSVSNAMISLETAQRNAANFERDQAQREKQNAESVTSARLRLRELDGQNVSADRDRLARLQAREALQRALQNQEDELAKAEGERQRVANAAEQAQLALNQARRKEREDTLNDIDRVKEAISQVGQAESPQAGSKILEGINASVENVVKGIIASSKGADEALSQLRGDITDVAAPAPQTIDVFKHFGEVLRNIENPALRGAVASRLLGRTIKQELLNVITDPQKLDTFREHVAGLGIDFEKNETIFSRFRTAMFTFQSDIALIGQNIAAAFGPAATQVLEALNAALLRNKDNLVNLAQSISGSVVPVIESFIRVLSGAPDAAKDQWLIDYKDNLVAFGEGIAAVARGVAAVISVIIGAARGVASALNTILGTHLNAFDVLIGAFAAKIALSIGRVAVAVVQAGLAANAARIAIAAAFAAGASAADAAAAGTAAAAASMATSFAPVVATLLVLGSAIIVAVTAWNTLKDAIGDDEHTSKWASMVQGLSDRLHALREILAPTSFEEFKQGFEDFKKANADQIAREKQIDADDLARKKSKSSEIKDIFTEQIESVKKLNEDLAANAEATAEQRVAAEKRVADALRETGAETEKLAQKQAKAESKAAAQAKSPFTSPQRANIPGEDLLGPEGTHIIKPGTPQEDISKAIEARQKLIEQGKEFKKFSTDPDEFGPLPFLNPESGVREFRHPSTFDPNAIRRELQQLQQEASRLSSAPEGSTIQRQDQFGGSFGPARTLEELNRQIGALNNLLANGPPKDAERIRPPGATDPRIPLSGSEPAPGVPLPRPRPLSPEESDLTRESLRGNFPQELSDAGNELKSAAADLKSAAVDLGRQPDQQETQQGNGALSNFLDSVESAIGSVIDAITNFITGGGQTDENGNQVASSFSGAASSADNLAGALDSLVASAQSAAAGLADLGAVGATVEAAEGGHIRGPGTSTSDSILSWLSDGEYVHPTRAVQHYGLNFMNAVRNLSFPRFAAGGLFSLPRFRDGGGPILSGAVAGGLPHLGTVDLTTDHGTVRVHVERDGLAQLRRAAVNRNLGAERKPSWVK